LSPAADDPQQEGLFPSEKAPAETDSGAPPGKLWRMPEDARCLGSPWDSLVGEVPGLTAELERDFRFGQTVFPFTGGFRLGGSLKGGSSTTWRPANQNDYHAYHAWKVREGIPEEPEDLEAFETLAGFLAANQVELWNLGHKFSPRLPAEYLPKRGWVYRTALDMLRALPPEHVSRAEFAALQLGGWGPASAKASAYENGRVFIYDFALGGAKRTMAGLFLHEMGHAHEAALTDRQLEELAELHAPIAERNALFGLEFLLDAESRKVYQQFLVTEFVAETYVAYAAAGPALREHVAGQSDERTANAWQRVYEIFKEGFSGAEYE
jgi:hypothetical protein